MSDGWPGVNDARGCDTGMAGLQDWHLRLAANGRILARNAV